MDSSNAQSPRQQPTSNERDRVSQLLRHLQHVANDATTPLDTNLLEDCGMILPVQLKGRRDELMAVVKASAQVLPVLQQRPEPLIKLLIQLLQLLSFGDVLSLDPPVDLVQGLHIEAGPFNELILSVLHLASRSAAETAHLANMHLVVKSLVYLWLATPDIATAVKAGQVVLDLLRVDKETFPGTEQIETTDGRGSRGQGLMWRRIFCDRDIYGLLYSLTSIASSEDSMASPGLSKKQRSLAQARLMSTIPKMAAMSWEYVTTSQHSEIESRYRLDHAEGGLLDYVLAQMADYQEDVLINMHLLQTFADLLVSVKVPSQTRHMSLSLEYLHSRGLHDRACSYWLKPDDPVLSPGDIGFLFEPSASYTSTYLRHYPQEFLGSKRANIVMQRLAAALDRGASRRSQGTSLVPSLGVLASVPRIALLPSRLLGTGLDASPLLKLSCQSANPVALRTIAHILHGPERPEETFPAADSPEDELRWVSEAASARMLYYLYQTFHPTMYSDLILHASTVALPDLAFAAMEVLSAIASARWALPSGHQGFAEGGPPTSLQALPSPEQFTSILPTAPETLSDTGIEALLEHGVREKLFPWLLKPPQTFSHLVGGGGDPESSAYRVAMAKWDLLQLVHKKLRDHVEQHGVSERNTLAVLQSRLSEGPWGTTSGVGSSIGTLEL